MRTPKRTGRRVLLAATIGLATLAVASATTNGCTSGNLMAPPPDAGRDAPANDDANTAPQDATTPVDAP